MSSTVSQIAVAVLALGVLALLVLVVRRSGEIACLSIRDGRILVVRGTVPGGFVDDLADVARRSRIGRGTVRVVRGAAGARIEASGLAPGEVQRIRNILGTYSIRALRQGAPIAKPNLGQMLGIAWLAWWLTDRGA